MSKLRIVFEIPGHGVWSGGSAVRALKQNYKANFGPLPDAELRQMSKVDRLKWLFAKMPYAGKMLRIWREPKRVTLACSRYIQALRALGYTRPKVKAAVVAKPRTATEHRIRLMRVAEQPTTTREWLQRQYINAQAQQVPAQPAPQPIPEQLQQQFVRDWGLGGLNGRAEL